MKLHKPLFFFLLSSLAAGPVLLAQDPAYEDLVPPGEEVFAAPAAEASLGAAVQAGTGTARDPLPTWVDGFNGSDASVTWNFILPEARYYALHFRLVPGAIKPGDLLEVYVDGKFIRALRPAAGKEAVDLELAGLFLKDGTHELTLWKGWKELKLGGVRVVSGDNFRTHRPSDTPVNPNASPEVRRVLKFLADIKGKNIIAGQQDLTWSAGIDMLKRVEKVTGKQPGLYGLDFINIGPSPSRRDGQVDEAIRFWERGGLVAFCWHWKMSKDGSDSEFYTKKTKFRINRNPDSPEYQDMIKSIDNVAKQLKYLQDKHIPVLWRPLHEASGGWFWWGASGPADYIWLWNLLYDRLTNLHKLDNLIWVWNGQSGDWYPGNATVDVIGQDIYPKGGDHSSQIDKYLEAMSWAQEGATKIVAYTENGALPDPDQLIRDGAGWTWFMTWNDAAGRDEKDNFWSGQFHTTDERKKAFYNHPYVLTLDEMPSFKGD